MAKNYLGKELWKGCDVREYIMGQKTNLSKNMYYSTSHVFPQLFYKTLKKWITSLFVKFPFTTFRKCIDA
jgi:hypothetical protein